MNGNGFHTTTAPIPTSRISVATNILIEALFIYSTAPQPRPRSGFHHDWSFLDLTVVPFESDGATWNGSIQIECMYEGSPSTPPTSSSTNPLSKPAIANVRPKHFANSSLVPIPSGSALGMLVIITRSPIFIGRPLRAASVGGHLFVKAAAIPPRFFVFVRLNLLPLPKCKDDKRERH
jgi:hypothetical protein